MSDTPTPSAARGQNETSPTPRGMTTREVARLLRVGEDRVRSWIRSGKLGAVNTSDSGCARPRFVVLPHHLDEFTRGRSCAPPPKVKRTKRRAGAVDYFPGD
jgi:excisionase family DNA binding protein